MIFLKRGSAPGFWTRKRVKEWTRKWLERGCKSDKWAWPQYRRKRLNQHAREQMEPWHHGNCAFCEAPLGGGVEVEHFRSKVQFPLAAFVWRNLFLICPACNNAKGKGNHQGCLKPDREDPADYLWVNPISWRIEPRPGISAPARQRATRTIRRYGLDRPELTKLYKVYLESIQHGHLYPLVGLLARAGHDLVAAPEQILLRVAGLQTLANPGKPFSLLVRSLLEYHGALPAAPSDSSFE